MVRNLTCPQGHRQPVARQGDVIIVVAADVAGRRVILEGPQPRQDGRPGEQETLLDLGGGFQVAPFLVQEGQHHVPRGLGGDADQDVQVLLISSFPTKTGQDRLLPRPYRGVQSQ